MPRLRSASRGRGLQGPLTVSQSGPPSSSQLSYAVAMAPRSLDAALRPQDIGAAGPLPPTLASVDRSPAAQTATRLRFENWDRLRVVAALDTVALHLTDRHALLGVGLPLFLMLSVALGVSRPAPPSTERFVRRRIDRVIVPWIFWALAIAAHRAFLRCHAERHRSVGLNGPCFSTGPAFTSGSSPR